MENLDDFNIIELFGSKLDIDREVYRKKTKGEGKYNWRVIYKYSDIVVSCDRDIRVELEKLIKDFYRIIESFIKLNPSFQKSLSPVTARPGYPPIIGEMCKRALVFNVGPMATVAGAVCDYIAGNLTLPISHLVIENGGDLYIKSKKDVDIGIYVKNKHFKDKINLKIKAAQTPCGLCSSSGSFGHSLSLGKSDLVSVLADTATGADGAATSAGNKIDTAGDISKIINIYKDIKEIKGLLIIKDSRIGIWGNIELIA